MKFPKYLLFLPIVVFSGSLLNVMGWAIHFRLVHQFHQPGYEWLGLVTIQAVVVLSVAFAMVEAKFFLGRPKHPLKFWAFLYLFGSVCASAGFMNHWLVWVGELGAWAGAVYLVRRSFGHLQPFELKFPD